MKNVKGITLIALVITIVVLIILSSVGIYLTLGNNGILNKAEYAKNETIKQTATEKMNLKITNMQIEKYAQEQRMPTLQEFADGLCEDDEIQYVQLQSKKVGSLNKIEIGNASSIFTKLKEYPYEFEINSSLQLASIDGIQVANNNDNQTSSSISYDVIFEFNSNDTNKCANAVGTYTLSLGTGKNSVDDYKCIIVISQGSSGETEVSNTIWNFSDEKITKKNYTELQDYNKYYQYCNSVVTGGGASYYIRYSFFDTSFEISDIGTINRRMDIKS